MLTPAPPSAAAVKALVLTERAVVGVEVLVSILKHEARTEQAGHVIVESRLAIMMVAFSPFGITLHPRP